MCNPNETAQPTLANIMRELMLAVSSLQMQPHTIPGAPEDGYLSEVDANARHAVEHLQSARAMLEKAQKAGFLVSLGANDQALVFRSTWGTGQGMLDSSSSPIQWVMEPGQPFPIAPILPVEPEASLEMMVGALAWMIEWQPGGENNPLRVKALEGYRNRIADARDEARAEAAAS